MRTAFIQELIKIARENPRIFLLVGDLGFSVVEPFAEEFPDRFLNVGIAEQNMTGIAAGLAMCGYHPFTYSIGNFSTLRCLEQIRNDICYHNLPVTVVAVGSGFSYGPLGATHHATEDLGVLRTMPNLTVCSPGDPLETQICTRLVSQLSGPSYLRLGKAGEPSVHKTLPEICYGESISLRGKYNRVVCTTGGMLALAKEAISTLDLNLGLVSFPFVKPIDQLMIKKLAKCDGILTIEEHQINCGFGSAIVEVLSDLFANGSIQNFPRVDRLAIADCFMNVAGSREYLLSQAGLHVSEVIHKFSKGESYQHV